MKPLALLAAFPAAAALGVATAGWTPGDHASSTGTTETQPTCVGDCVPRSELVQALKLSKKRLRGWRYSARRAYQLHVTLAHRPSSVEAIELACTTYRLSCSWMKSRGSCESTGGRGFNPNAKNPKSTASGLFQFLTSTWSTTPYARFSIFSPYANALAAGWMMGPAGRAAEWVCR